MRTSEVDFVFPVIGFTKNADIWGWPDADTLTKCGPATLKEQLQDGMEIIASDGRRWRVLSVTRTGRAGSRFSLARLFQAPAQSRIEHDLEPLEPASLDEVKARVRRAIEAHPEYWSEGDEGEPEREAELNARRQDVDVATSIGELYATLGLDTFEGY